MKRSDQDIETPIKTKEPRLEVEESATFLVSGGRGRSGGSQQFFSRQERFSKESLTTKPRAQTRTKISAGGIEGIFTEENYGRR